jgi:hypothetical protein
MSDPTAPDLHRCGRYAGHPGDCEPGYMDTEKYQACTLRRLSMDTYEPLVSTVTNDDNWPELDGLIPIGWTAIVDAENDLVAIVPPAYLVTYGTVKESDSLRRAKIIAAILNAAQED